MYVNNLPFTETLQMAQRDMYDIDTLLLQPMKKMKKIAKRKKIVWGMVSGLEHSVGIAFGIFSATEVYNQRYLSGFLYITLMAIGAATGFDSASTSNLHDAYEKKLDKMITETQNTVNSSLPEQLHEIAEIVRQQNKIQR